MKISSKDLVEIGFCSKAHGIKGGLTLNLSDDPCVINEGDEIYLYPDDQKSSLPKEGLAYGVERLQVGNKVICYLEGVEDRNVADSLIPFRIYFSRSLFPELVEGEIYPRDLLGLKVFSHLTKKEIGLVEDYYDNTAQLVLVLAIGPQQIDLPFVEQFFPVVELEEGRLEVKLPKVIE